MDEGTGCHGGTSGEWADEDTPPAGRKVLLSDAYEVS
jgi:hypothetical protein